MLASYAERTRYLPAYSSAHFDPSADPFFICKGFISIFTIDINNNNNNYNSTSAHCRRTRKKSQTNNFMTKRRSTEEVDGVFDHAEIQGSLGGHRPEEELSLPVFNLREGVGALLPARRVGRCAGVLPQEEFG
jgi:hypothetical protein